jgi:cell division transport system permease protein
MFVSIVRFLRNGLQGFYRNAWLSFATILIMTLALLVVGILMVLNLLARDALGTLEDKIDVSIYFKNETLESDVLKVKREIESLPEVKSVEYVSKEKALRDFKEKHQGNEVISQSIAELEGNPLQAVLNVKAHNADQYEVIVGFAESKKYENYIKKIDYGDNRSVINKLNNITKTIEKVGLVVSSIFLVIVVLVTFNTIRLTIYTFRQEIEIMRLVGAPNWYIRMPFVVTGFIYGAVAAIVTLGVSYPVIKYITPRISSFLPGTDMLHYFVTNFWLILGGFFLIGVGLGILSSFIAVRRYLKI